MTIRDLLECVRPTRISAFKDTIDFQKELQTKLEKKDHIYNTIYTPPKQSILIASGYWRE